MSVEFSNTYQEILLENLVSIIKQNFVFQTQLKIAERIGKEKEDLQAKFDDVNTKYNAIINDVVSVEQLKARAEMGSTAIAEKERIQFALNESMKTNVALTKKIQEKETEISKLKEYIEKLEGIAPTSKLKKVVEKKKEPVESETPVQEVDDGSSF